VPSLPTIETTADGSATLRSPLHGDTYHSLRGAVGEARHVFIEAGFLAQEHNQSDFSSELPLSRKILEMGFGTGLNAWLTLEEAARTGGRIEYTAVELYPVPVEVAARLNYTADPRFMALHAAPWGEWTEPAEGFRLRKLQGAMGDILDRSEFSATFDLVYWDAFAPDTQPELWTAELFARVFETTAPGGVLVTYSSKGDVRRALRAAGFAVERLPGALGKRHMLRATNNG
jgi:tRNA U34 5-methylaminomethyl-2-thiouridine-forming methyltransferase MnmC